jgi:hypothetical protein
MHILPDLAALEGKYAGAAFAVVGVHSAKFDAEKDSEAIRSAVLRYDIRHALVCCAMMCFAIVRFAQRCCATTSGVRCALVLCDAYVLWSSVTCRALMSCALLLLCCAVLRASSSWPASARGEP